MQMPSAEDWAAPPRLADLGIAPGMGLGRHIADENGRTQDNAARTIPEDGNLLCGYPRKSPISSSEESCGTIDKEPGRGTLRLRGGCQ